MDEKLPKIRTLIVALLVLGTSMLSQAQKAVGERFKVDNLYYKVTKISPLEVEVSSEQDGSLGWWGDPYYKNEENKPKGDIIIPAIVNDTDNNNYAVTGIGDGAFKECQGVLSVKNPDNSITKINQIAFEGCLGLKSVTIPNSVTTIGAQAFHGCKLLTEIVIPVSVKEIGTKAFYKCESLKQLTIGGDLIGGAVAETIIGESAFDGLGYLEIVNIGNSVKTIGNNAFSSCGSLKTITIPNSVTSIGSSAFYFCSQLSTINMSKYVTSIGQMAFSATKISTITLPEHVTTLPMGLFNNCTSLSEIIIPKSVTNIEYMVFYNCPELSSLTVLNENPANITIQDDYAFDGIDFDKCTLYVPVGKKSDYKNSEKWNRFTKIKEIGGTTTKIDLNISLQGSISKIYDGQKTVTLNKDNYKLDGLKSGDDVVLKALKTEFTDKNVGENKEVIAEGFSLEGANADKYQLKNNKASGNIGKITPCEIKVYADNLSKTSDKPDPTFTYRIEPTMSGTFGLYGEDKLSGDLERIDKSNEEGKYDITQGTLTGEPNYKITEFIKGELTISKATIVQVGNTFYSTPFKYKITQLTPDKEVEVIFNDKQQLTGNIEVPETVKDKNDNVYTVVGIGEKAFQNQKISTISIPNSIIYIDKQSFMASDITKISVPKSVQRIEEKAFYTCQELKEIDLSKAEVTKYGKMAFAQTGIKQIVFPNNMITIPNGCFQQCNNLLEVIIPSNINEIKAYAFYDCASLQKVTIGTGVTKLGQDAFSNCGNLSFVTSLLQSPTSVTFENSAFRGNVDKTKCILYVPMGKVDDYKNAPNEWSTFNKILEIGTTPKVELTVSLQGSISKNYDGQKTATLNKDNYKLEGLKLGDDVVLKALKTEFTDKNVGENKEVIAEGFSLEGTDANNYQLKNNTASGNIGKITPCEIKVFAHNLSKTTDKPDPKFTYRVEPAMSGTFGLYDEDKLSGELERIDKSNEEGKYDITQGTLTGEPNYKITEFIKGQLTISKATDVVVGKTFYSTPFKYKITNADPKEVEVIYNDQQKPTGDIEIPETTTDLTGNTYKVIGIGYKAFYKHTITNVNIPNTITYIGKRAFDECSGLKSVTIPNSVTEINDMAFEYCPDLEAVVIGGNVKFIGMNAFEACPKLRNITFGSSVETIKDNAFAMCSSLKTVSLPESLKTIKTAAFLMSGLEKLVVPNSVETMGNSVVSNCKSLKSVTIGDGIKTIGTYCFIDCSALTDVIIGSGITSIGKELFRGCAKVTSITSKIKDPSSITLGTDVFKGITDKSKCTLYVPEGTIDIYSKTPQWKEFIKIEENNVIHVESIVIKDYANQVINIKPNNTKQLEVVFTPSSPTNKNVIWKSSNEDVAEVNTTGLVTAKIVGQTIITVTSDDGKKTSTCTIKVSTDEPITEINLDKTDATLILNSTLQLNATVNSNATNKTLVWESSKPNVAEVSNAGVVTALQKGKTTITVSNEDKNVKAECIIIVTDRFKKDKLYYQIIDANNKQVNAVSELAESPYYSHDENKPQGEITIPEKVNYQGQEFNVINITSHAFELCMKITKVTIDNAIISIGENAFRECNNITNVTIGNSVQTIGKYAFQNCIKLKIIEMGSSVNNIGQYAFAKTNIENITIPNTITNISAGVFANCTQLKSVNIPNNVKSIGNNAFYGCLSLNSIVLPKNISIIEERVFASCTSLSSIEMPNSITEIKDRAFNMCSALKIVTIPEGVKVIGNRAFDSCTLLDSVTIPNSVNRIGERAFGRCTSLLAINSKLKNPDSKVVILGDNVFEEVNTEKCILYIPKGTSSLYAVAKQWEDFMHIKEEGAENDNPNSIYNNAIKNIKIYPTIISNGFNIEADIVNIELCIYNILGEKVYSTTLVSNHQFIDVSNLHAGIYFVKISNKTIKIIKE